MFARPSAVFHHKNVENVTAATSIFFRNDRFYSNEHSTLLLFKCKLL